MCRSPSQQTRKLPVQYFCYFHKPHFSLCKDGSLFAVFDKPARCTNYVVAMSKKEPSSPSFQNHSHHDSCPACLCVANSKHGKKWLTNAVHLAQGDLQLPSRKKEPSQVFSMANRGSICISNTDCCHIFAELGKNTNKTHATSLMHPEGEGEGRRRENGAQIETMPPVTNRIEKQVDQTEKPKNTEGSLSISHNTN